MATRAPCFVALIIEMQQSQWLPRGDACSARHPWTPAEAAEYAVRRDVRLLQLLSSDRSAFRAARRLGVFAVRARAGTQGPADHSPDRSRQQRRRSATTSTPQLPEAQPLNSAQRRSARRRHEWWQAKLVRKPHTHGRTRLCKRCAAYYMRCSMQLRCQANRQALRSCPTPRWPGQKPPLTLVRLLNQQQQLWQFHLRQGRRRPRVLVAAPPPRSRARWSSHRRPARPPAHPALRVGTNWSMRSCCARRAMPWPRA